MPTEMSVSLKNKKQGMKKMNKAWKEIIKRESSKVDWKKAEANKGMVVVGFRYGDLHPRGYSVNHTTGQAEPGHSMASVMGLQECGSFAALANGRKRVYVMGEIAGTGSDDEVCLVNVKKITRAEYLAFLRENKDKKIALKAEVAADIRQGRPEIAVEMDAQDVLVVDGKVFDKNGRIWGFTSNFKFF